MSDQASQRRKSILVTGAASGIGRATATLFSGNGWFVGCLDRDARPLENVAHEVGIDNGFFRAVDVTDRAGLLAAVEDFGRQTDGHLDMLFSNAGIDAKGMFADMDWSLIQKIVDVNLMGSMSTIQAALPLLRATPGSLCLSTASASAIFGTAGLAVYSATKHAVKGLTEALSVEFAAYGVRAADILPGIIDTGMLPPEAKAMLPTEGQWRVLPALAVAQCAWDAYHSNKVHYYVPEELAGYDVAITSGPEAERDVRIANPMI